MKTWRLLLDRPGDAAWNMAVDEAVLHACSRGEAPPTLRLYGWNPPAVSVGYFQDVEKDIDLEHCRGMGWPLVRRLTGGRAVLHHHELTYSVVAPVPHPLFPSDVGGTYRVIAEGLRAGLQKLGVQVEVVSARDKGKSGQGSGRSSACFAATSWFELAVDGKKVAGSAQRRWADAFLQHGSIILRLGLDDQISIFRDGAPARLADAMTSLEEASGRQIPWIGAAMAVADGLETALSIILEKGGLSDGEKQEADKLAADKYLASEWNLIGPRKAASMSTHSTT